MNEHTNAVVRAFGRECRGCQKHKADVMISGMGRNKTIAHDIQDFFLSTEDAKALYAELGRVLDENRSRYYCPDCNNELSQPNIPADPKPNNYAGCIICGGRFRFDENMNLKQIAPVMEP